MTRLSSSVDIKSDLLYSVRQWLDSVEIHHDWIARSLCQLIPAQCPFEREIKVFNHRILYIPPLCKLNPLYDQFVGLRFRSLTYLAEQCGGEDVTL
ncbi:MAG: nitrogenase [Cyanothece sp. SIO1E1]|nr:nitrogenase [Cyanothece sp. SIO1E1]